MSWQVEENVTCVVCPDCAFTFSAEHVGEDGRYTCPQCELDPLGELARAVLAHRPLRGYLNEVKR